MSIEITDVKLIKKEDCGNLLAVGSIVFNGCFVVKDIKVLNSTRNDEMFIGFPSKKITDRDGGDCKFIDIAHPIDKETHAMIKEEVLAKYNELG